MNNYVNQYEKEKNHEHFRLFKNISTKSEFTMLSKLRKTHKVVTISEGKGAGPLILSKNDCIAKISSFIEERTYVENTQCFHNTKLLDNKSILYNVKCLFTGIPVRETIIDDLLDFVKYQGVFLKKTS